MDKDLDRLLGDHGALKHNRTGTDMVWQNIIELLYPDGTPPMGTTTSHGGPTRAEILDNSGEDAAEQAASALHALTTNAATRWFELGLFEEDIARDTDAGAWLWRQTTKILRCFRHPTSLFHLAVDEDNQQLIRLGNSALHVEERMGRLPLYRCCPMAQIWWEEGEDGQINRVDREFQLTAISARDKWGSKLPKKILDAADGKGTAYDLHDFLHISLPRHERNPTRRDRGNMAYRSVYIATRDPTMVIDGGSHELEYITSRWSKRAGERYGRGCGHKALSDIEVLQRLNRVVLLAGERTIDPPILAPEDGITGSISFRSRAINVIRAEYMANGAAPRALLPQTRVDIGLELIADRRELVRRSFMKQLLELARDPKFTATQFMSLEAEQKRGLAPILARQGQERLGPLVSRTFNILLRMAGIIDPAPPAIAGMPLQPNFDSPDARIMRLGVAQSIAQAFESFAPIIKATGDDALYDNFDLDEGMRALASGAGMPSAMLRPVELRDRMRAQRNAMADQAHQLEAAKDASVVAKNTAPLAGVLATAAANANQAPPEASAPPPSPAGGAEAAQLAGVA